MKIKCACGCGIILYKYDSRGRERRFLVGHYGKLKPPMKGKRHTLEAKNKLREARKKQKDPWTEENKEKQRKRMLGKRNPFYGKKHTKKTIEKISKANKGKVSWWKGRRKKFHKIYGLTKNNEKQLKEYLFND